MAFRVSLSLTNRGAVARPIGPLIGRLTAVQPDGHPVPGSRAIRPITDELPSAEQGRSEVLPQELAPGQEATGVVLTVVPKWTVHRGLFGFPPKGPFWTLTPSPVLRHRGTRRAPVPKLHTPG